MKMCITSEGPSLEDKVDLRFGRARYFIFVDSDTLEQEPVENPYIEAMGGAGIQTAQFIAQKGAQVVITGGNFGPNASRSLESFGVEMIGDFSGTVKDAIEKFKNREFIPNPESSKEAPEEISERASAGKSGIDELRKDINSALESIEKAKEKIDKLIERK